MKLALIGDVHAHWTAFDTAYFNSSDYDAVLFTGDLPGRDHRFLPVARALAELTLPCLLIPGNHDGPSGVDVLREALWSGMRSSKAAAAMGRRVDRLKVALGPVTLGGYSLHQIGEQHSGVEVIACRPHAMDSRRLTFGTFLRDRHSVADLEHSAARLQGLIEASTRPLILLAHNGPAGLGSHPTAPWGLRLFGRDNGDQDLADAVSYARGRGKPILAVVAGHMHYRPGRPRTWQVRRDGVLYINAARVPRIDADGHHHVCLEIRDGAVNCHAVYAVP